jgi:MoaA/NifB/PqqE/SkfB family radical SAM enzyme
MSRDRAHSLVEEGCRFRPTSSGVSVMWELLRFCNLRCAHCCTLSSPEVDRTSEIDTASALRLAHEFIESNIRCVFFSGGEPFLFPGFTSLLKAFRGGPTEVYVASNGTLIDDELACEIVDLEVTGIDISIDGHTAEIHNAVRKHASAFDRAMHGVIACVKHDVPLRVSGMITPANLVHIPDFVGMLADLGVKRCVLQTVIGNVGRAAANPGLELPKSKWPAALNLIATARSMYGSRIQIDHRMNAETQLVPGCPAGKSILMVTPEGKIAGCPWLFKLDPARFTLGNIRTSTLSECLARNDEVMRDVLSQGSCCPIPHIKPH